MSSEALDTRSARERAEAYIAHEALNVTGENEQAAWIMRALLAEVAKLEQERDEAREYGRIEDANATRLFKELRVAEAALAVARKREQRARRVVAAYTAEAEDWNDGEFALWGKDDLVNALVALRAALVDEPAAGPQADSGDARGAVVWSEPRQDYTGRFYRDGLGTGTGAEADALLNATLAEPEHVEGEPAHDHRVATSSGSASAAADEPRAKWLANLHEDAAADEPGETPA